MDREQAKQEALRRAKRKKMGRRGPPVPTRQGQIDRPRMDRLTAGQLERLKRTQNRLEQRPRFPATGQGMLTGGQAKLDKNKNNKIDAQDFKILRAEKAKGRGKGLQDEKMKPGKVMKADKGKMIKKDPTAPIKNVGVKDRYGMPMKVGKQLGSRAAEAAKATRIGKIAAGVAGAALAAKAGLEKLYEKRTGKKPFTKREKKRTLVDKKMGGGMMMRKPMGGGYMGGGLTEATQRLKAQGKMGGGMMMRPNPVGMKSGKSVKVKCKLGRNKPTKMY